MQTKVSVIIPVYNSEQYLKECIESIRDQTYKNVEIVIVDDGSTDSTKEIIEVYLKIDERISAFYQDNKGPAQARNNGMTHSVGDYFLFFDSDDILNHDTIQKMVDIIEKENADIVMGNYITVNHEGKFIEEINITDIERVILENGVKECSKLSPNPGNKLYKADIIKKRRIKFCDTYIGEDLNFYLKFLLFASKIAILENSLYQYRILSSSISRTYTLKILDIIDSLADLKEYYNINGHSSLYSQYLTSVELIHFTLQICKVPLIDNKKDRKIVIKQIKKNKSKKSYYHINQSEQKVYKEFMYKIRFGWIYTSNIFSWFWRRLYQ